MSRAEFEIERRRSDSAGAKGRLTLTLTRTDVIKAGAQLLESEGVEKLSMRKLATALGTFVDALLACQGQGRVVAAHP